MSTRKFNLSVSLEDEWAERTWSKCENYGRPGAAMAERLADACNFTDSGSVIDPNGNKIGEWGVTNDKD